MYLLIILNEYERLSTLVSPPSNSRHQPNVVSIDLRMGQCLVFAEALYRILVQVAIYHSVLIGQDGHLD